MKLPNRKGQSLLEVLISLTMLTMGFLGITALLSQSFFMNRIVTDQAIGTYLAAEGIEIAKNLVDHDVYAHLASPPVGTGWGSCFGAGGDFQLDYTTTDCSALVSYFPPGYDAGHFLKFDPATHLYGYGSSASLATTVFTRDIRVSVPNANEIIVNSIVHWSTGPLTSQSINLEDHFYNWHP